MLVYVPLSHGQCPVPSTATVIGTWWVGSSVQYGFSSQDHAHAISSQLSATLSVEGVGSSISKHLAPSYCFQDSCFFLSLGTLKLMEGADKLLWSVQVDHQLFALEKLDVTVSI